MLKQGDKSVDTQAVPCMSQEAHASALHQHIGQVQASVSQQFCRVADGVLRFLLHAPVAPRRVT